MQNQPPHTASIDQIVGRLLQLWNADNPITLSPVSSKVMMGLQFDQEKAESRLTHASAQNSAGANTVNLQRKLDAINGYLNIGQRIEATLANAVQARIDGKDTGIFNIVLHIEENDPYQHEEGLFTTVCIYDWASQEYEIKVPEWAPAAMPTSSQTTTPQGAATPERDWSGVSIRLLPDDIIGYSIKGGGWKMKPLSDTGFVDQRKNGVKLNKSFEMLANLAELAAMAKLAGHHDTVGFGAGKGVANGQDRARKNKLCKALKELVGVEGNPFTERSPDKGYQPHFTVEDKRHDSTQRDERMTYPLAHYPEDKRDGATQHDKSDTYDNDDDPAQM